MESPTSSGRAPRAKITEVYASVQGESTHVGKPCVFIRLTGCNLRCTWCDSEFTFSGGEWKDLDALVEQAHAFGIHTIEVTGGEPLLQKSCIPLMERLLAHGHEVLLETSGSLPIGPVPDAVHVIMDLKPPDSGEEHMNLWANITDLQPNDEVKIVLASRRDYEWARDVVREHDLTARCPVLFSPAWGLLDPADIVQWILDDALPVRFQLQLHKYIWEPDARTV